jgi:hypothetical protein
MSIIQAYTIVDRRTSMPFALRFRQRAAVVAFRTYPNALLTAHAIERRQSVMGTMAETYDLVPAEFTVAEPEHHYLKAWESYQQLVECCRSDDMDILYCTHLESSPGESIEFTGRVQTTEEL